ncbi:MAG: 50S ribosomal protein L21e [Nitrososphaeria archaeon]|nr:50S ribosomal protein L21e [Aigarchaeota archaeon]MCX8187459.1 50S ribosomal protein L21e [Nitrososphaeria archaeon]MDW8021081.1 50S ribosomal protein L21e [Nitrososphaerota archaeon]
MPDTKGFRFKSRRLLTRPKGSRQGPNPEIYLHDFRPGEKVAIKLNPSMHKGSPHRRYHGKIGEVVGRKGRAYVVRVRLGEKFKTLTVLPDHLVRWSV